MLADITPSTIFSPYKSSDKFKQLENKISEVFDFYFTVRSQRLSTLSIGQIQLFALTVFITMPHSILLLDEPTAALHQNRIDWLVDVLKKKLLGSNTITIIVSHDSVFIEKLGFPVVDMQDLIHQ